MVEHRVAQRRRMLKMGTIEFGGGGIDCTVKNLSETGAALEVVTPLFIPDRFTLLSRAINSSGPATSFGGKKSGSGSPSIRADLRLAEIAPPSADFGCWPSSTLSGPILKNVVAEFEPLIG